MVVHRLGNSSDALRCGCGNLVGVAARSPDGGQANRRRQCHRARVVPGPRYPDRARRLHGFDEERAVDGEQQLAAVGQDWPTPADCFVHDVCDLDVAVRAGE